jgi:hypothetical protein
MDEDVKSDFQAKNEEPNGFRGLLLVFLRHFHHLTLYNPIACIAGITFLASTLNPWWHATVIGGAFVGTGRTLDAFAFYLSHNVPPEGWRFIIETPISASVVLVLGLLGYFFIVLWGATSAKKKGKRFVACGGLLMLIYTAGFFGTIFFACYRIGGSALKEFPLEATFPVTVEPLFLKSYYFAIGSGIVCLLSSLIHGMPTVRLHRKKKSDIERGA